MIMTFQKLSGDNFRQKLRVGSGSVLINPNWDPNRLHCLQTITNCNTMYKIYNRNLALSFYKEFSSLCSYTQLTAGFFEAILYTGNHRFCCCCLEINMLIKSTLQFIAHFSHYEEQKKKKRRHFCCRLLMTLTGNANTDD